MLCWLVEKIVLTLANPFLIISNPTLVLSTVVTLATRRTFVLGVTEYSELSFSTPSTEILTCFPLSFASSALAC